jgi:hypothetical protein
MFKSNKRYLTIGMVLLILFSGTVVANASSFVHAQPAITHTNPTASAGKPISGKSVLAKTIDMQNVPAASSQSLKSHPVSVPFRTGVSPQVYAQRKAAAAHYANAVRGTTPYGAPTRKATPYTPVVSTSFAGMSDSVATCPPFGCEPPDQALAVSFSWVFQGVNTSFNIYSLIGAQQTGWPKTAQSFFGVPNPGACDPNGPFLTDPRAFYDSNNNLFWAAIQQSEGVAGGPGQNCPFLTRTYVAVSKTGDPRGAWNIYSFDMTLGLGTNNWADYTQFGFDQQAIYFDANMLSKSASTFQYPEVVSVKKVPMQNGLTVTPFAFKSLTVNGIQVDTVQPVLGESLHVGGALGGQFINSFNINFGGGQCSSGCSGIVVWSMKNPGTSTAGMNGIVVSTSSYSLAPQADEPGCSQCIETIDTRISGTPVWQRGIISFALETSVNNGSQNVPGIFWGQVVASLNDDGSLAAASLFQSGYFFYTGDTAASFGALGADSDGDLYMVFENMSSTTNPGVMYTSRRATLSPGIFHDGGLILKSGDASYVGSRWGDYEAVSPSGVPFTNDVWFSGQYSNTSGDWSTWIGHDKFVAGQS